MNKKDLLVYAITDCDHLQGQELLSRTETILANGATILQYRDKEGKARADVPALLELCRKYNVPFIINDDVALAVEVGADGVHVGQDDEAAASARATLGPNKIVGVTAKTVEQAKKAVADGADYLGCGALYASGSKNATRMTRDTLKEICASVDIPVVGIGGINEGNAAILAGTGVVGAAVIAGLYEFPNPTYATRRFATKMNYIVNGDKDIDGILVDVDGTLADTLAFYQDLLPSYLRSEGHRVGPDLVQIIAPLSMPESVGYVKHNYSTAFMVGDVVDALEADLEWYYHTEAVEKPGAKAFLERARDLGIKVSATSIHDAEVCRTLFEHIGVERLLGATASGWDKRYNANDSRLFTMGADILGGGNIWAFNDAIEGVFGAKGAQLKIAAIYDKNHSEQEWKQIVKNADVAFMNWEEAKNWLVK